MLFFAASVAVLLPATEQTIAQTTPTPIPTYRPASTPAPVDTTAILGLWEGTSAIGSTVTNNAFKFSRTNGILSAVWISETTRNLTIANISLFPDGTITIKDVGDGFTITFVGKVEPTANKMSGTLVMLANSQRYVGTWQAIRKVSANVTAVTGTVSDGARFKQIILDIAMGKIVPQDDQDWAERYEKQNMTGKPVSKPAETDEQKKKRAQPFFDTAMMDFKASNFLGALSGFSEYLKLLPNSIDVLFNRGVTHNRLGQSALALADFEQVLRLKPDHTAAMGEAARTRAMIPTKVESLTSIVQVIDVKPTDFIYRDLQSLIERYGISGLTTGRKFASDQPLTLDAFALLTANGLKALKSMSSGPLISDARFAELFNLGCPMPKVIDGSISGGEVASALKCTFGPSMLTAISPEKPIDRGYFAKLLNRALDHGRDKISANSKLGSSDSNQSPSTADRNAKAEGLYVNAITLIDEKKYEEAIRTLNQVIEINPEYVDAYRARGLAALLAYEGNKNLYQLIYTALNNFDLGIGRGMKQPQVFYLRGRTQEHLNQKSKAIADYREAIKIDPSFQLAKDALAKLGLAP